MAIFCFKLVKQFTYILLSNKQVYRAIKEKERRKRNETIDDTENIECYDAIDHERKVTICECTTDLCNQGSSTMYGNNYNVITNIIYCLLIILSISYILKNLDEGYI